MSAARAEGGAVCGRGAGPGRTATEQEDQGRCGGGGGGRGGCGGGAGAGAAGGGQVSAQAAFAFALHFIIGMAVLFPPQLLWMLHSLIHVTSISSIHTRSIYAPQLLDTSVS